MNYSFYENMGPYDDQLTEEEWEELVHHRENKAEDTLKDLEENRYE